jgi:hypothetical protein
MCPVRSPSTLIKTRLTHPAFNIDYPLGFDNHPRSGANSTAPTRPNSRIGRPGSALSTHLGDAPRQSQ